MHKGQQQLLQERTQKTTSEEQTTRVEDQW